MENTTKPAAHLMKPSTYRSTLRSSTKHTGLAVLPLILVSACSSAPPHNHAQQGVAAGFAASTLVPRDTPINNPGQGSMTVTEVTCGLKKLPYPTPSDAASMMRAAPKNQICIITATFTNTETGPLSPAPFGNLVADNGQTYPEDTTLDTMTSIHAPDHPNTSKINHAIEPGQSVEFRACFQIPTSIHASSLAWPGTATHPQSFILG